MNTKCTRTIYNFAKVARYEILSGLVQKVHLRTKADNFGCDSDSSFLRLEFRRRTDLTPS